MTDREKELTEILTQILQEIRRHPKVEWDGKLILRAIAALRATGKEE